MKLAVISDIHSNHISLKAALDYVDSVGVCGIIYLGDYVTDCPYPCKTMELLYLYREKYPCWFIRGNREEYLLRHRRDPNDGWGPSSANGALYYTYENLTAADLDFFESLPLSMDISLDGCPTITACHSVPDSGWRHIFDDAAYVENYAGSAAGELILMGHAHKSRVYDFGSRKVMFCPSVGFGEKEDEAITMLTLVGGEWQCERVSVKYNSEELIREFDESGLSEMGKIWTRCFVERLKKRDGRNYPVECVRKAWHIANSDGFSGGVLPEKYWMMAAEEMGLLCL